MQEKLALAKGREAVRAAAEPTLRESSERVLAKESLRQSLQPTHEFHSLDDPTPPSSFVKDPEAKDPGASVGSVGAETSMETAMVMEHLARKRLGESNPGLAKDPSVESSGQSAGGSVASSLQKVGPTAPALEKRPTAAGEGDSIEPPAVVVARSDADWARGMGLESQDSPVILVRDDGALESPSPDAPGPPATSVLLHPDTLRPFPPVRLRADTLLPVNRPLEHHPAWRRE